MIVRDVTASDAPAWLRLRRALWPHHAESEHAAEITEFLEGHAREPLAVLVAADGADQLGLCRSRAGSLLPKGPLMERVTGIGGLFFRAQDPAALGRWYRDHLGVTLTPSNYDERPWQQEAGPTAFAPFPVDTPYFGDSRRVWMVNFRVRELDAMVAQLRAAGIEVTIDAESYPNGRFARLHDPEGNPIELWQPAANGAA